MSGKTKKPCLTENEIHLMMELYNLGEADEPGLREWLSYQDVNLTKEAAAKLLEIKKQFDSGLLNRTLFEEGKKNISNDYDKKLDKKSRIFVATRFGPIFLIGAIACFVLWITGILSFNDERPTTFVIHQEAQLINISENTILRLPSLKLLIKIQDDPVFREVNKEINASSIMVNYNTSIKEPMVDVLVYGERSGRGLIEIESIKLPLRPRTIEWIAVITFRDKEQENKWLADIDREKFILK